MEREIERKKERIENIYNVIRKVQKEGDFLVELNGSEDIDEFANKYVDENLQC